MTRVDEPHEDSARNLITWPHDDVVHGYWVEPGRILAGEYPGSQDPSIALAKISLLMDNGIRTFIDLTQPYDGLTPYDSSLEAIASTTGLDVRRIAHPIPDMGVLGAEGYDLIVDEVHNAAERGGVYLHCWGGIGRTATVVGCLLVDQGLSYEGAMRTIKERRSATKKAHVRAPQTFPQREIIMKRAERHTGASPR